MFIGAEATDLVKVPFGLDLPVGARHGAGTVVLVVGVKMRQVPLWRSYLAGCILPGMAPCTALVLVWGYLARGNDCTRTRHWVSTAVPPAGGADASPPAPLLIFPRHGKFFPDFSTLWEKIFHGVENLGRWGCDEQEVSSGRRFGGGHLRCVAGLQ